MEETRHVTVGLPVEEGWQCVDDAGRPHLLPRTAVDAALRHLRVGQRLAAELRDGQIVRVTLP